MTFLHTIRCVLHTIRCSFTPSGVDRQGQLLTAWTNFERRAFAVLNDSKAYPVTTTNGKPERLLVWENTLLDWTFVGAVVGAVVGGAAAATPGASAKATEATTAVHLSGTTGYHAHTRSTTRPGLVLFLQHLGFH